MAMTNEITPERSDDPEHVELYVKDSDGNYVPVEPVQIDGSGSKEGYIIAAQRSEHIGPLPSVEQFRAYGAVVPDAPERILQMAEKDQKAYHDFMTAQLSGRLAAVSQGTYIPV